MVNKNLNSSNLDDSDFNNSDFDDSNLDDSNLDDSNFAFIQEAGGEIKSIDNKKFLYNSKESVTNPHFIASCNIKL